MAFVGLLLVIQYIVLLLLVSVHDAAQAAAARRLGDATAAQLGRVSLNPGVHFNPFGMLLFPLVSFYFGVLPLGWGNPVPMIYRNFPRRDGEVLATLAGPLAQLLVSLAMLVVFVVLKHVVPGFNDMLLAVTMVSFRVPMSGLANMPTYFPLLLVVFYGMAMGLMLAIFNLLPVPFLDGGKVLSFYLPYNAARIFNNLTNYFMVGFFFLGGYAINAFFLPLFTAYLQLLLRL